MGSKQRGTIIMQPSLIDVYGRKMNYLRISVTDRCNLRCKYCMPVDMEFYENSELLSFEEMLRVAIIVAKQGVDNFRVTGGEPLVRRGCTDFIKELKKIEGVRRVSLTSNGVLVGKFIGDLVEAKLDSLNISLDTLDRKNFERITHSDSFDVVWASIMKSVEAGLDVKINVVVMKGVNDHELLDLARLAYDYPVKVRFIELMPTGLAKQFDKVPTDDILAILGEVYPNLERDSNTYGAGPAAYYKDDVMKGRIGFISPMTHNFCSTCGRLRLSVKGELLLCLHHSDYVDLREPLRNGCSDEDILGLIEKGVYRKPSGHNLEENTALEHFSRIGG